MLMHRDRRMTQQWAKTGPPAGSFREARWGRRTPCTGNQPALRRTPTQRTSLNDHGGSI
jgi:hypothetical protein